MPLARQSVEAEDSGLLLMAHAQEQRIRSQLRARGFSFCDDGVADEDADAHAEELLRRGAGGATESSNSPLPLRAVRASSCDHPTQVCPRLCTNQVASSCWSSCKCRARTGASPIWKINLVRVISLFPCSLSKRLWTRKASDSGRPREMQSPKRRSTFCTKSQSPAVAYEASASVCTAPPTNMGGPLT